MPRVALDAARRLGDPLRGEASVALDVLAEEEVLALLPNRNEGRAVRRATSRRTVLEPTSTMPTFIRGHSPVGVGW